MSAAVELLTDAGFVPGRNADGDSFGDHLIEFSRGNLILRLVRDRGEHFVRLRAVSDDEWFDSDIVLRALTNVVVAPAVDSSEESLCAVLPLLLHSADLLDAAFAPERFGETRKQLHAEELASRKRMFGF